MDRPKVAESSKNPLSSVDESILCSDLLGLCLSFLCVTTSSLLFSFFRRNTGGAFSDINNLPLVSTLVLRVRLRDDSEECLRLSLRPMRGGDSDVGDGGCLRFSACRRR